MFFNFDSDGRAKMTTTAPFGAVFMGGSAYNSSGELHVSYDTPASTDPRIGGIAHKPTGEVYVTADTSGSVYHGGLRLSANGAVCVAEGGTTANQSGGLPFASDGRLVSVGAYAGLGASDYDGTNDYATRGANLTGLVDGKQGTLSGWFRVDGGDGTVRVIALTTTATGGAVTHFAAYLDTNNKLLIGGRNAAAGLILDLQTTATFVAGPAWWHFVASWDLTDPNKKHLYISDASDFSSSVFSNENIDYAGLDFAVGAFADGTFKFNGALSELFFHPTYIDLSVETNRRKFITAHGKPASLGTNGSLPLGVQPLLYAPSGDPSTNLGSGGNLTVVGSLSAASTTPFGNQFAFAPLTSSMLADNGYSEDKGYYLDSSSLSRLLVSTDATSVDVYFYIDSRSNSDWQAFMDVGVWDGTTRQSLAASRAYINKATAALAAGTKTVEITSGSTIRYDGLGNVVGNHLIGAYFSGGTFATLASPTTSPRIVIYGDSIAAGLSATEPPNNSWAAKLRQLYSGSVMLEAWGYRSLNEDGPDAASRTTFANRIASYSPTIIWLAIGTNDQTIDWTDPALFGAAYADLLDKLHAASPSATIWAQSPIVRTSEGPNGSGDMLQDYRDEIQAACAVRAWCNFSDGSTYMATTDLADGVHPNTTGHNLYYEAVKAELGL